MVRRGSGVRVPASALAEPTHESRTRRPRVGTWDWGRWLYRAAGWIAPERNPAGVVYGLIAVGALLAAESGLKESYPETVGSTAIAVTLYWFAHSYADVLGLRLLEQRRVSFAELRETFIQDWSIARGAGVPLLAILV